jgi:hypothetical protein
MKIWQWVTTSFIWLLLPAIIYLSPFLIFPAFNIIDDGASLLVAEQLRSNVSFENWSSILVEKQVGRFRPFYHLSLFVIYVLFGLNPFYFWLAQVLILGFTLVGMALLLHKLSRNYWLSALAPLVLLFFSPVVENFYRLGTAEPKQMLVWVWMLVLLVKVKELGWSKARLITWITLFVLALLLKETSVIFGGLVGVLALWNSIFDRQRAIKDWGVIVLTILAIGAFLAIVPKSGDYSSGFQFNLLDIKNRLFEARLTYAAVFFPLVLACLATVTRFIGELSFKRKLQLDDYFWPVVFLTQIVAVVVIGILPWRFQLPRYYYPVYLMVILYIAQEINAWTKLKWLWQKFSLVGQFTLATGAVALATLLQIFVFQSSFGLSLKASEILDRLLVNRLVWAPVWFLLLVGVGVTVLRLLTILNFNLKLPRISWADVRWPIWFGVMIAGVAAISIGPWHHLWPRMMLTVNVLIFCYYLAEINAWQQLQNQKWFAQIKLGPILSFATLSLVGVLGVNYYFFQSKGLGAEPFIGPITHTIQESFDTHQVSYALIRRLIAETPADAEIYVSSGDYEIIFEVGLYASRLKQRPVTIYTDNQQLLTDVGADFPYLKYTADPVTSFITSESPNKILLLRKQTWDIFTGVQAPTEQNANLLTYQTATNWASYSAQEMSPPVTFNFIPAYANWVWLKP